MTFGVRMGPDASPARWQDQRWRLPRGRGTTYRKLQSIKFLLTRDREAVVRFLLADYPRSVPIARRLDLIQRYIRVTNAVRGYHTLAEMLAVSDAVLRLAGRSNLTVVEAGAGSGSSTAKLSLVTQLAGGRLIVFDSFRGIPENDERHRLLDGRELSFRKGAFKGRLTSVKRHVATYGAIEVCDFRKGLFEETLPSFSEPVDVVLLDVDLIASTRTCTRRLFPLIRRGGALFSQDGHLQATVDLFSEDRFWRDEVGVAAPIVQGLGADKILRIDVCGRPPPRSRSPWYAA